MHTFVLVPEHYLRQISFPLSPVLACFLFHRPKFFVAFPKSDTNEALPLDRTLDPAIIPSSPIEVSTFQTARSTLLRYMSENPAFHTSDDLNFKDARHISQRPPHFGLYSTSPQRASLQSSSLKLILLVPEVGTLVTRRVSVPSSRARKTSQSGDATQLPSSLRPTASPRI